MKKTLIAAALALSSFGLGVGTMALAAPQLTIQSEQKAHPNIMAAVRAMHVALTDMEKAPDDFGGNKAAAIADTKAAIHSLKRALYFRLKLDDKALDAAE
jgi:hypothetical protein